MAPTSLPEPLFINSLYRTLRRYLKTSKFWQDNDILLKELKYFPRVVLLAILFAFLAAIFEGFSVGFLLAFLQSLTDPQAEAVQTGIAWFDTWILGVDESASSRLYRISFLILLTTLLRSALTYFSLFYSEVAQHKLAYQLRLRVFEQFQSVSFNYFAKTRSGELINILTTEIGQVMRSVEFANVILVRGTVLCAYIVSMLLLSWQLTVASLLLFSLLSVGITVLLKYVREASFATSRASSRYTSIAVEFLNGIRTIKAFAAEDFERKRFYEANTEYLNAASRGVSIRALVEPLAEGGAVTILIGMLVVAFATLIPTGQLQVASLLTFLFILFRLMPIVRQLNGARAKISNFSGSIANLQQILLKEDKPYLRNGHIEFQCLQDVIEFRSVDFGYDQKHIILHNINLKIEKGKTTALVGASGAGKSTVADLIPRFYDPLRGEILIDGINLKDLDIKTLRSRISVVSQDTFIFNDSIRNNIAYALEDIDDSKVFEASKLANALDFIQELPLGFDTVLGDRGVRLSGGQRQRIAIARALLRNPEILILDEATSALDSVSEKLIQESIEKLSRGRTVIAIAHRLSTVSNADKIVVLEKGEIIEQGQYKELLERRGKLWSYHQMQYNNSYS